MIPLRDNIPPRTAPFVNYTVIALSALVFLQQLQQEPDEPSLIERYGMIPARVVDPDKPVEVAHLEPVRTPQGIGYRKVLREAAPAAVPAWLTLLTCVFLHGGWMHFIGNMWFLHIFGDNVEDCLGHLGYILFYLGCGVAASAAHLIAGPGSTAPTIGASGAIAGVMGAYFVFYPRARVLTLVPIIIFFEIFVLPAPVFLGVWFAFQFFQGAASITSVQDAGVAWWAHIGGFAAGFFVALLLKKTRLLRPPVTTVRPNTDRVTHYRVYPRHRDW